MIRVVTKSADDTREMAGQLARVVRDKDLILLSGELGAGKTTFAQGFGESLGAEGPITSPTFTLVRTYSGRLKLHHVDVCRLDSLQEIIDLGLVEMVDDGGVALIEWGEMAAPVLPADYLQVFIEPLDDDEEARQFRFRFVGRSWDERADGLSSALSRWMVGESS